jgi:RNA polymerase sigma-70 factor, ECF subfamily
VTLDEQDRSGWNPALIAEGHALVRACVQTNRPGPYQIQAAVNAVHTSSREFRYTGWSALATLYDQLYELPPTPIVALNRAVVTAELDAIAGLGLFGLTSLLGGLAQTPGELIAARAV